MSLELTNLRPVPPWFRNIKKVPPAGSGFSTGGKALLIGLGVDGTTTLSLIANQLDLLGKNSARWQDEIQMVSIGVNSVQTIPTANLHNSITTINLEPNLSYFRKTTSQKDLFAQWWHDIGKPTSGRGLARLALFTSFKERGGHSPLYRSLIHNPNHKNISTSYVITSLTDTVGTALMWDILHFKSRNNSQSNAALSVLWLSLAGSKPNDTQGNAWNELQRLGNGGNIQAAYNESDIRSNHGYIKMGASRTIIVGQATKKTERLENTKNSLKLLANTILWTLDSSYHREFKEAWGGASGGRTGDSLNLNLNSIGLANFYQPIEHIENIATWRIVDELLWGGLSKGRAGLFDIVPIDNQSINLLIIRFLRNFKANRGFFSALANFFSNKSDREEPHFAQETIPDLVDLYKEQLIYQLDILLNGQEDELQSQTLRSFYGGHLFSAYQFIKLLNKGFKKYPKNQKASQPISLMQNFTEEVYEDLEIWLEVMNADKTTGLRRITQSFLRETRTELDEAYKNKDHFSVLLNNKSSAESLERESYKEWIEFLLAQEGPSRDDPISIALSRVGWHFTFDYSNNALGIEFCAADVETKDIRQVAFTANKTEEIANSLYRIFRPYTNLIFKKENINDALSSQFENGRDFANLAKEKSMPYMGEDTNISSIHILGRNENALRFAVNDFEKIGQHPKKHWSSKSPKGKIGVLSIRNNLDTETLFARPPRIRKPREYIFAAERAYDDFSKRVYMQSGELDRNFAYLLSEPTLAKHFGNGLLLGYIRPDTKKVIFNFKDTKILLGQRGERILFYRSHVLLAAMEDFVIELPAKANIHHPLHPRNRQATVNYLDKQLLKLKDKEDYQNSAKEKLAELKDAYTSYDELSDLSDTFFLWLSVLYDDLTSY